MSISIHTALCDLIGIRHPIVLAPMAGIPDMAPLVSAVSAAGGLGTLGAAYLKPEEIRSAVREIRESTEAPFAVNLFARAGPDDLTRFEVVNEALSGVCDSLEIPHPERSDIATPDLFEEQFAVLLEEKVPILSLTFGLLAEPYMQRAKKAGMKIIATATTVNEAILAERAGCDAIAAQGSEAGGHRGTFDTANRRMGANVGTMALVPQIVDAVGIPVIAAGGIMDGRGLAASLALGASGVQMGTRFLTSLESGAHPAYKQALLGSTEESTVLTDAFSGRPARGIANAFIRRWTDTGLDPLPFPTQNTLTREIRNAAARQNDAEHMALWAGQGTRMLTDGHPAGAIVRRVVEEAERILL
ncbi:nitronate monooxygenase family protein [Saccharibacillus sp. CPCC 101409]|uniref:NAD(P)H-dependent flavin oxidoreductase n=1 Tax=Saccharibacillus sp. CPCC 101409 TaxID=3058041 RepID=UPI0026710A65|nr:nitronate monooxygenase family protein [Saccharibacillus sp. CPCC 101409]MDO3412506.1 nitronate monooxygenase family protein [Saccharibacillus sp. CPCC 101409]